MVQMEKNMTAPKKLTDTLKQLEKQQRDFSEKALAKDDTDRRIQEHQLLTQLIASWKTELERDGAKPDTITAYSHGLKTFMTWLADRDIKTMRVSDLKDFRNELSEKFSPKTVNLFLTGVRAFYAYLVTEDVIPSNPAREVKSIPLDDTKAFKRRKLDADEVTLLLSAPDDTDAGKRTRAILALMVFCGLRRIEVHRLDLDNVEIHKGRMTLQVTGKGRVESEPVKVPSNCAKIVRAWIDTRENTADSTALFTSLSDRSLGARLSLRSISENVTDTLRAVGLGRDTNVTVHSLRHTAVSHAWKGMLREAEETGKPADPLRLQRFARHRNFKDTQRYLHLEEDENPVCDLIDFEKE